MTGSESAAYNPLDLLDPESERFAEDAVALTEAIVSDPPDEVREAQLGTMCNILKKQKTEERDEI